ncbi:MAG: acetylxylan esterase [Opitutales bacterium]|nr:acetylxylan esterase [Opitutales bacterium]
MDREKLISLLGRLPEKGSPDLNVIDEVDCGSYLRRTIEYSVERGERVRAFLCMPVGRRERLPALVCFHQHAGNRLLGKSEVVGLLGDSDQAYAKELAERGYITLATDAICFEDRCQNKESPDYNHVHQLHIRLIEGKTLLGKVLSDVSSGVDLLASLPEVDPGRIGFIGHSYGGRVALFAPVFDRRIKSSVCSCGSANYRSMPGIQFDFVVPGILEYGDIEDIVCLIEPANLFITGGEEDKWSVGIDSLVSRAAPSFTRGAIETYVHPGGHNFAAEMRRRAYEFLDKYLNHQPANQSAQVIP